MVEAAAEVEVTARAVVDSESASAPALATRPVASRTEESVTGRVRALVSTSARHRCHRRRPSGRQWLPTERA